MSSRRRRPLAVAGRPLRGERAPPCAAQLRGGAAIAPGPRTARTAGSRDSVRCIRASSARRAGVVTAPLRVTATISNGSVQPGPIDFETVS